MTNKKEAIVDAAVHRIAEQGSAFSTGQVASDLGCSQSLVFRYYRSKEVLMSACFDRVCHELKLVLKGVEVPRILTRESIDGYLIDVWEAYCGYLDSNSHIAKAYMYFVSTGRRYPHRYRSAETILKRILEGDYDRIVRVNPDFRYTAEYIVMLSNVLATGKFLEWRDDPDAVGRVDRILRYGILGWEGADEGPRGV